MTKSTKQSAVKKNRSWMINISGDGAVLIDPRDGKIVFVREDYDHWYKHHGFTNLERLSLEFNLGFDFTQFMEFGPEEDDPTWFHIDAARVVVMEILAKLSVKAREAILEDCR